MEHLKDYIQPGIIALLSTIVVGLLGWRGVNKVGNDNARNNRQSRFEQNLQDQLDAEVAKNTALRDRITRLEKLELQLKERDRTIRAILQSLTEDERAQVARWIPESAFAPPDIGVKKPKR